MADEDTPHIDKPGYYHICVNGYLDKSWSSCLSGLSITCTNILDGSKSTELSGLLADQAALIGVLNTLYNLGFTLLKVERLTRGENSS